MSHEAKILKYEVHGDATIVITARCCDDPISDSSHREHDFDKLEANIAWHLKRVSDMHAKRLEAEKKIAAMIAAQSHKVSDLK